MQTTGTAATRAGTCGTPDHHKAGVAHGDRGANKVSDVGLEAASAVVTVTAGPPAISAPGTRVLHGGSRSHCMDAGSDMLSRRRLTSGASLTCDIPVTIRPASTPSSSACATLPGS